MRMYCQHCNCTHKYSVSRMAHSIFNSVHTYNGRSLVDLVELGKLWQQKQRNEELISHCSPEIRYSKQTQKMLRRVLFEGDTC